MLYNLNVKIEKEGNRQWDGDTKNVIKLKESLVTNHLERSQRLKGSLSTYQFERS